MGARIDLTGKTLGQWTVLREDPRRSGKQIWWVCRCSCGITRTIGSQHFRQQKRQHCGCLLRTELLGKIFGRLTVKKYLGLKHGLRIWKCQCACGTEVIAKGNELTRGNTSSCGCWRKERIRSKAITHGLSYSDEYRAWAAAKSRCTNPNDTRYDDYGGRGISMCQEWLDDFMVFYHAVGLRPSPDHSLDRINVNGHYEPGNVRWATRSEQQRNRRPFAEWRKKHIA